MHLPNKVLYGSFFLGLLFLLTACSSEQRLAMKLQKELPEVPFLVSINPALFITNSKLAVDENLSPNEYLQAKEESIHQSKFVKQINAEDYLFQFQANFNQGISKKGFTVFPIDSISRFLTEKRPSILLDFKQLEIEEYYSIFEDENYLNYGGGKYTNAVEISRDYFDDSTLHYVDLEVNSMAINAWINVIVFYEDGSQSEELLFMDYLMHDIIEGEFRRSLQGYGVGYVYNVDEIEASEIWTLEVFPAQEFADNCINYMINKVIKNKLGEISNKASRWNWQMSDKTGRVIPTDYPKKYIIQKREDDRL
jgi:hypothetical protein